MDKKDLQKLSKEIEKLHYALNNNSNWIIINPSVYTHYFIATIKVISSIIISTV